MINSTKELDRCINEYQKLCKIFGNILDAPFKGGNISVKSEHYLVIKSSGEDLKKEHKVSIFKDKINSFTYYQEQYYTDITKPSMEIKMHTVFKNKYVAHYHPVYILPYLCAKNYRFNDHDFIDFVLPGDDLWKTLNENYIYKEKGVVMLKNHGVIIYAEEIQDVFNLYINLKEYFCEQNNSIYTPDDAIDTTNAELWLFRNTIENIARNKNLDLVTLKQNEICKLLNLPDEKYRRKIMESENKK
ncbi:class II aldolase/adducin family protein [Campylobacter sp. CCS1377]|uniref:Class II aldolase/adducin family protein n=1 Tax=Campylobacter sp. CCS1377 TaxID=3158229 RepID=A0AAU7E4Z2_9BACT|nr:class II aldolase/adducin family protein [Campylobacter jejuni]